MTDCDVATPERAIRRMQAAAVERGLVDGAATEPHLVLAGALEGARSAARESELSDPTALTPAMTAVLALFGVVNLPEEEGPESARLAIAEPPTPPMPPDDDRRKRFRVTGARVARDLGACSLERAASLAAVSEAEFERIERRSASGTGDR